MLKIVISPNPILAQKTKQVAKIGKATLALIEEMKLSLLSAKDPEGVGLAAPQVGHPLQIFVTKPSPKSPIQVFINPAISQNHAEHHAASNAAGTFDGAAEPRGSEIQRSSASGSAKISASTKKLEGCLSLPNIWGEVAREPFTTLSYLDEKGASHTRKFSGLLATIVQHEIDHLNGTLFPKRVLEQKGKLYKSHKDEKGEDVFEEIKL